jgi:uncharacterized membrane protein YciS (DUF1049 family)
MIIVGFVLVAAVVVIAVALVVQNPATVSVHAFNQSWNVDMRWLVVAGLALTAVGLLGLGVMRLGGARYLRLRGARRVLTAENKRLTKRVAAAAPVGIGPDTAPRTAPVVQPGEPVGAAASSHRHGFRDRLAAMRHRPVGG